ncbi:MAG: gamma carbonic anhydrase family protein [Ignavibacteria bacterium]|nr:gamma carbonic anhydrase family protein [Ignavibacteria bacterium]
MPVLSIGGKTPRVPETVFVADGAYVIGDVDLGEESSVWFQAVLRGDINTITIGPRSNIQDGCVFHVTDSDSVAVGSDVTIGHRAIIHGSRIGDESLIGMGAVVLDGASIGKSSLVAAGAVVLQGMEVPDGVLAAGVPARIIRGLTEAEKEGIRESAVHYVGYARSFSR